MPQYPAITVINFDMIIQVYVLEWNNADWWYVRKHLTEESGWVPAQYLKDEQTYTLYVQKKLVEKIEKLPVFDRKFIQSFPSHRS